MCRDRTYRRRFEGRSVRLAQAAQRSRSDIRSRNSRAQLTAATRGHDTLIGFDVDHRSNPSACGQLAALIAERAMPRCMGLLMQSPRSSERVSEVWKYLEFRQPDDIVLFLMLD